MEIISNQELQKLLNLWQGREASLSFLEPFTWEDDATFIVRSSPDALVFYRLNPIRITVQYLASDIESLSELITEFSHDLTIKLPASASLNLSSWGFLGIYQPQSLDFHSWGKPQALDFEWAKVLENMGKGLDHHLVGPEKKLLRSLQDCMFVGGEKRNHSGFCAFRLVGTTYMGMYLFNQGLSVRDFSSLFAQALSYARNRGAHKAQTIVNQDNKAANFLHQSLGFRPSGLAHSVWSNNL